MTRVYKEWSLTYQSYLYFEANTCLQEMANWRRGAIQGFLQPHTLRLLHFVWIVPHLPNFNHHTCTCQTINIVNLNFHVWFILENEHKLKTDLNNSMQKLVYPIGSDSNRICVAVADPI